MPYFRCSLTIGDDNYRQFMPDYSGKTQPSQTGGESRRFGSRPRDWSRVPYGSTRFAAKFSLPIIPMSEWPDRIKEMHVNRAFALYAYLDSGWNCADQDGLNYCHAYSPAQACRLSRRLAGLPDVELSAGSIGGPVTGYRNEGAWIGDDLAEITTHGIASTQFVPMDAVKKSLWKQGADEDKRRHIVEEWDEIDQRNILQQGSALLQGYINCVGYNWWSHAVNQVAMDDERPNLSATDWRRYAMIDWNSWGPGYGDNGIFKLTDNKMVADEAYVCRVQRASTN